MRYSTRLPDAPFTALLEAVFGGTTQAPRTPAGAEAALASPPAAH